MEEHAFEFDDYQVDQDVESTNASSDDSDIPELDKEIADTFARETCSSAVCGPPNPIDYISATYFAFDRESYKIMLADLKRGEHVTLERLKECKNNAIHDLKKWRRLKDDLKLVRGDEDGDSYWLCLKASPHLLIASMEDWEGIIQGIHCKLNHLGIMATLDAIKSRWCIDMRKHGIPVAYIKDVIKSCQLCKSIHNQQVDFDTFPDLRNKNGQKILPKEVIVTNRCDVDRTLCDIMIKHKVRLVLLRTTQKNAKTQVKYICHRGGTISRKGSHIRRLRISKKCGCPFKVKVEYIDKVDSVSITLHAHHEGHLPGSRNDLYHLPVHPLVLQSCMDDLFDVGSCPHVARMSLSKESFHKESVSPLDLATFRFFMIRKEVQTMSYQLRMQGKFMCMHGVYHSRTLRNGTHMIIFCPRTTLQR